MVNCVHCGANMAHRASPCPQCRASSPYWKTLEPAPGLSLFIGLPLLTLLGISFLIVCFIGVQVILLFTR
jgi:hypothetical protein